MSGQAPDSASILHGGSIGRSSLYCHIQDTGYYQDGGNPNGPAGMFIITKLRNVTPAAVYNLAEFSQICRVMPHKIVRCCDPSGEIHLFKYSVLFVEVGKCRIADGVDTPDGSPGRIFIPEIGISDKTTCNLPSMFDFTLGVFAEKILFAFSESLVLNREFLLPAALCRRC